MVASWFRLRDVSLRFAILRALGLLVAGAWVTLLLLGPWGHLLGWLDPGPKPLSWENRLKAAAAVVTASGAVVALTVSYRKQRDAEEGRFATLFAEAAGQLGNSSPAVRIAGFYAIAALADRYAGHRQQCIEALCGYMRLPYNAEAGRGHLATMTEESGGESKVTTTHVYRPEDREVRLTIIRIIRDHLRNPSSQTSWCGHDLDFTGATFDGGDFTGACFTGGQVSFDRAHFMGGAYFTDAGMQSDEVTFYGAQFIRGRFSFNQARFVLGHVSFQNARFAGAEGSFDRVEVYGAHIDFDKAEFAAGRVTFDDPVFVDDQRQHPEMGVGPLGGIEVISLAEAKVTFNDALFTGGDVFSNGKRFRGHPKPA